MYLEHTPVPFLHMWHFSHHFLGFFKCNFLGPYGTGGRKNRADLSSQSLNTNLPALVEHLAIPVPFA